MRLNLFPVQMECRRKYLMFLSVEEFTSQIEIFNVGEECEREIYVRFLLV